MAVTRPEEFMAGPFFPPKISFRQSLREFQEMEEMFRRMGSNLPPMRSVEALIDEQSRRIEERDLSDKCEVCGSEDVIQGVIHHPVSRYPGAPLSEGKVIYINGRCKKHFVDVANLLKYHRETALISGEVGNENPVIQYSIGEKVHYTNGGRIENGIVKGLVDDDHVRVVYNCGGDWFNYHEYTSALTNKRDIKPNWSKEAINN